MHEGVPTPADELQTIPSPAFVREWLGRLCREVEIVRRLLRISEQAARERAIRQEDRHD